MVGIGKDVAVMKENVGNLQKHQAEDLLHSAQEYAKANDSVAASKSIRQATDLFQELTVSRLPIGRGFFDESVQTLSGLNSSGIDRSDIHSALTQLAEYRSALVHIKIGPTINCAHSGEAITTTKSDTKITNVNFKRCSQALDNFIWTNVVFVDSTIVYRGGPLILNNVIFVNCKFEVEPNDGGYEFLEHAALEQKELKINPNGLFGTKPNA